MKLLAAVVAVVFALHFVGCQTAESKRTQELARSWETWVTADIEVLGYRPGQPDAFLAVTWGSLCAQLYPSNVSQVRVLGPSDFAGQVYDVAVPDQTVRDFDPAPWRAPGSRFRVTLSEVYLKYRPWGFIPYDAMKGPNKAPEPTPGPVTGRADARPAPVPVVAHL